MGIDVSVITQHGKRYNCSEPCENGAITGKALRERIVDQLASSGMSSSNLNITCAGVEIKSVSAVNENMRCEARVADGAVQDRARPRSESPAFRKPRRTYGSGTNPATIHSRSENQFCEARAPRRSLACPRRKLRLLTLERRRESLHRARAHLPVHAAAVADPVARHLCLVCVEGPTADAGPTDRVLRRWLRALV
jgi:hypothetical protein